MNVNTFLRNLLQGSGEYALTENDVKIATQGGVSDLIVQKLYSKKYRKWKLDDECKSIVIKEVSSAVENYRPINVFFAQGCYKLWRVSSSPMVNWAEFFNIAYLISYLAPIAATYSPGVTLTYYFLTVLPQTHNNLGLEEVKKYYESFSWLLAQFRKYLPDNLKVEITTDLDLHSREEYDLLLSKAMAIAEERFYAWPQSKQTDYIRRAWLNIKWDGVHDWTALNDEQKMRVVKKAVLYEYAATQDILVNDKRGRGVILSTLPKEDSIGIGSTATSVAKHWVGEGVLERDKKGDYYPRILSPSQYDLARLTKHTVEKVKLFEGLGFEKIELFPKHFDFSQK